MEHYAETGDFRTFSGFSGIWLKKDESVGGRASECKNFFSNAINRDKAREICNSITSKLSTNNSDGTADNKLLIGCPNTSPYCTDSINRFSVSVKLQDNNSISGNWFCIGTSGAIYEGSADWMKSGCFNNP